MPPEESFKTAEHKYHTAYHEQGHATREKHHLARPGIITKNSYGSPAYAAEEVIAETSAMIRSTLAELDLVIGEQSLAYIKGWDKVRGDTKVELFSLFDLGQYAANYTLGLYKPQGVTPDSGSLETSPA